MYSVKSVKQAEISFHQALLSTAVVVKVSGLAGPGLNPSFVTPGWLLDTPWGVGCMLARCCAMPPSLGGLGMWLVNFNYQ